MVVYQPSWCGKSVVNEINRWSEDYETVEVAVESARYMYF